ncbi:MULTISPECIES: hypothetical protein [Bacillus cereus group]|uniref:Uncharacterized protein n=1 Tax=Bacillus cereus TaxID=1396 RepID=A0A1S9TM74_BACCE|nr:MULTISPECIES: hypothetical protein [Bacillus cereus group]OOR10869.1 hypothetical protein BW897_20400 [Bacillus cereus]WOA60477.1 hypothetical protein RVY74_27485 [Bacillus mycoides]
MCLILTISTQKEILRTVQEEFEVHGLYINKVIKGPLLSINSIYTLDNGMCSCDFFSDNKESKSYQKLLNKLFKDLYKSEVHIGLLLHWYKESIESEKIRKPKKMKISFEDLTNSIHDINQDVLYKIY